MGSWAACSSHLSWSHLWCHQAPQPHASLANSGSAKVGSFGASSTSFHTAADVHHQAKSARNSLLTLIWWWGCRAAQPLVVVSKSIICRRNECPGLTTLHAWLRILMRDSNSLLTHTFRSPHSCSSDWSCSSFSAGRQPYGINLDAQKCQIGSAAPYICVHSTASEASCTASCILCTTASCAAFCSTSSSRSTA